MIPFRNTKTSHADDCLERNTVHATNAEVHGRSSRSHLVSPYADCYTALRGSIERHLYERCSPKKRLVNHRIIPFLVDICWYQTLRKWISCQSALTLLCGIWTVETFGIAAPNWHEWWIEVMMLYLLTCDESGINAVAIWVRLRTLMISHDWVRVCLKSHFISFYHILAILVADYCILYQWNPWGAIHQYPSTSIYSTSTHSTCENILKRLGASDQVPNINWGAWVWWTSLAASASSAQRHVPSLSACCVGRWYLSQEYHKYVLSQLCTFST